MRSQDALDHVGGWKRFGKRAKQAWAIKKQHDEEAEIAGYYYKRQRIILKCEEVRRKQLRDLKLYVGVK